MEANKNKTLKKEDKNGWIEMSHSEKGSSKLKTWKPQYYIITSLIEFGHYAFLGLCLWIAERGSQIIENKRDKELEVRFGGKNKGEGCGGTLRSW